VGSDEGDILNERTKNPTFWRLLVGLLLFVGLAGFAEAADGIVVTYFGGGATVAIDSVGRIVTAGWPGMPGFVLTRYNSDGSFDTTFGNVGVVVTDFSSVSVSASAQAMAMDSLGRIMVLGNAYHRDSEPNVLLARYNPDGSLDATFGNGGIVVGDFTSVSRAFSARGMAIDTLGRIVLTGSNFPLTQTGTMSHSSMALARYNFDGSLDPTFGNGGIVTTDIAGLESYAFGVTVDSIGRIVVAGRSNNASGSSRSSAFTLARFCLSG
jgi:uncharacterized delta-60 repeat protein